jgi:hypothetical protein
VKNVWLGSEAEIGDGECVRAGTGELPCLVRDWLGAGILMLALGVRVTGPLFCFWMPGRAGECSFPCWERRGTGSVLVGAWWAAL